MPRLLKIAAGHCSETWRKFKGQKWPPRMQGGRWSGEYGVGKSEWGRVQGSGFRCQETGIRFRRQGSGVRDQGSGVRGNDEISCTQALLGNAFPRSSASKPLLVFSFYYYGCEAELRGCRFPSWSLGTRYISSTRAIIMYLAENARSRIGHP